MARLRISLLAMATVGLVVLTLISRQHASLMYSRGRRYEDVYYLPPADWLNPMSVGFNAAAADIIYIRSILYFGTELSNRGQSNYLFNYIDACLKLDPDFRQAYLWAATAGMYHAGTITADDGYRVAKYLEAAVKRWPDDGELYWELGALLRFEMAPLVSDPEEKQRLYASAIEPLATAARLGAGPPWLAGLNAQLMSKLGKNEQAMRHIEEMYELVKDPGEKEQMRLQLARLRSETYAAAFDAANRDVLRERDENYPYVTSNFFLLLGPRINPRRIELLKRDFRSDVAIAEVPSGEADAESHEE